MSRTGRSSRGPILRVVIADGHRLLLEAVRALLEPESDIEVVGMTYEADRILGLVAELGPDLLLLDFNMPAMDDLALLDRLCAAHPAVAVVLLTESSDPKLTSGAFERGVKGVILKGSDPSALAPALRAAIRGENPRPARRTAEARGFARRSDKVGVAARLDALRALADRAIFGEDYDWL